MVMMVMKTISVHFTMAISRRRYHDFITRATCEALSGLLSGLTYFEGLGTPGEPRIDATLQAAMGMWSIWMGHNGTLLGIFIYIHIWRDEEWWTSIWKLGMSISILSWLCTTCTHACIQCNTMRRNAMMQWYRMRCNAMRRNDMQCNPMQCNAMQYRGTYCHLMYVVLCNVTLLLRSCNWYCSS